MKIFTVSAGAAKTGAVVETFSLTSGAKIPAIMVGEEGRGRKLGVLPVSLSPESQELWDSGERVTVSSALVEETAAGRPKLKETAAEQDSDTNHCLVVMKTPIGFRGSNYHGTRLVWELCSPSYWKVRGVSTARARFRAELARDPTVLEMFAQARANCEYVTQKSVKEFVEAYAKIDLDGDLPGQKLVSGMIAQGMAGRAGGGDQYIIVVPRDTPWAIRITGRLYGTPSAYEYVFDGEKIIPYTAEDLELLEV